MHTPETSYTFCYKYNLKNHLKKKYLNLLNRRDGSKKNYKTKLIT